MSYLLGAVATCFVMALLIRFVVMIGNSVMNELPKSEVPKAVYCALKGTVTCHKGNENVTVPSSMKCLAL